MFFRQGAGKIGHRGDDHRGGRAVSHERSGASLSQTDLLAHLLGPCHRPALGFAAFLESEITLLRMPDSTRQTFHWFARKAAISGLSSSTLIVCHCLPI